MPTPLTDPENDDASERAQSAAFREFTLAPPPADPRARELWMQHAAGFLLFEKVRAAGLATLDETASAGIRAAVELAVDSTIYALLMQIDGVSGGLRGSEHELELTFGVQLTKGDSVVAAVDLREGDGMCMGFHFWVDADFGPDAIVENGLHGEEDARP